MDGFVQMGGYAAYVWPAYGLAALIVGGLLVVSVRDLKARERELRVLQDMVPGRRGRSRDSSVA